MNVLVLSGNKDRWEYQDRLNEQDTMSGVEAYVFAFKGRYCHSGYCSGGDIEWADIIIANTNRDQLDVLRMLANSRPANKKWVTLIEGSLTDYIAPDKIFRDLLDASDLVTGMNAYGEAYFQALTMTRCLYIGSIYQGEKVRARYHKSISHRSDVIMLPSFIDERWSSWIAGRKLLDRFPTYCFGGIKKMARGDAEHFYGKNHKVVTYIERSQDEWLQLLAYHKIMIDLDPRYTWGRNVLDCAALEVPIICTKSKGVSERFFPHTTIENEFQVEEVYQLGRQLLSDPEFYKGCANVPLEKFNDFRPEVVTQKMLGGLGL